LKGAAGRRRVIRSDRHFRWRLSNILTSEIYCGEICDGGAARDKPRPVTVGDRPPAGYLHPSIARPMRAENPVKPVRMIVSAKGENILDFGRVLSGTVELTVSGCRGSRVVLQCADTLGPDGSFYNDNVELFSLQDRQRPVMQRIEYRLSGGGGKPTGPRLHTSVFDMCASPNSPEGPVCPISAPFR
jgi:hypothetical protein